MQKLITLAVTLVVLVAPVYAHNWDGEVKGDNWCQEYEAMIANSGYPDGRQTHEYMEQCGVDKMHDLNEQNISNMESYLKQKMGDRYPDRYPDDDSRN